MSRKKNSNKTDTPDTGGASKKPGYQRRWYEKNKEHARAKNRRQRAWERFELKRYRKLKERILDYEGERIDVKLLVDYFNNDVEKFNQWYAERYGSK